MLQSVWKTIEDSGRIDPDRLLSIDVFFSNDKQTESAEVLSLYRMFFAKAKAIPGVKSVSVVDRYPLISVFERFKAREAVGPISTSPQPTEFHVVRPTYRNIVGLQLTGGRWFDDGDHEQAEPVAVINEAMARGYFVGTPIGARVQPQFLRSKEWPAPWRVVGVVREPLRLGSQYEAGPSVYVPFAQAPMRNASVLVRTSVPPRLVAASIREQAVQMAPGAITVENVQTGADIVAALVARSRFVSMQQTAGGLLALLVASLGIYGVVAFHTSQRMHEIAVRMVLGSSRGQVLGLVLEMSCSSF